MRLHDARDYSPTSFPKGNTTGSLEASFLPGDSIPIATSTALRDLPMPRSDGSGVRTAHRQLLAAVHQAGKAAPDTLSAFTPHPVPIAMVTGRIFASRLPVVLPFMKPSGE